MRTAAWILLTLFVFTVPWEYSLEFGPPFGNVARIAGLLVLLAAIPALLASGRMRNPSQLHWLTLALFVWLCCACFWTSDPSVTVLKIRSYFQEMMIVALVWEFVDDSTKLRTLLRAWLAGLWVLAILTIASLVAGAANSQQFRFAAVGQDPNDVARFLDLGFPIAALFLVHERRWPARLLALGYLPIGLAAVLLTASRGGFLAALVALAGSAIVLGSTHPRRLLASASSLLPVAAAIWLLAPRQTLARLLTIADQLHRGDLNQRLNIWSAGMRAFQSAPLLGHGPGTFVTVSGLASGDTAHNTALAIAVEGGLCALFLAFAIAVVTARSALAVRGALRVTLATMLLVWAVSSMVGSVAESRSTWLLFAVIAVAERLAKQDRPSAECARAIIPLATPPMVPAK